MTGSRPQSTSVWQRSRHWATVAFGMAVLGGLLALALGHVIHGALLLLAALPLFKGSVWGRRGRRHRGHTLAERMSDVGQMGGAKSPERKLRKAA